MAVIAFIPVRGGSKSIPLKNIKPFCGMPLIYWNLKAFSDSESVTRIIVATDSDQIEQTVVAFNFEKVSIYRRSTENATDTASTESVMLEYLDAGPVEIEDESLFILAQATSPLTQTQHIDEAISQFREKGYDSMLTCVRQKRFFWNDNGTPVNYDYQNRPRRQDFDGYLMENGAFYINQVANIKRFRNRLSGKIGIYEMPEYTALELDEPSDWPIIEKLMQTFMPDMKKTLPQIKVFLSDVDGVLTDAGMYYSEKGDEMKKFSTYDGMAFQLLRNAGIKTGIITSEVTDIVSNRAEKLRVDYLYQGKREGGKLSAAMKICQKENISLKEVAYIGDDINCFDLLCEVGLAACPGNAMEKIKNIPGIIILEKKGGDGAVREFVEKILG